jgi:hexosaminidase
MQEVVEYAASLAVRVIPEFDNPGHVRAMGYDPALLGIIRCFNKDWANTVPNAYKINGGPPTGVLDPSEDLTYSFLEGIFKDMDAIFPDSLVHLGGDEVFTSCFDENPNIKTFMNKNHIGEYSDLITYYLGRARGILEGVNPSKQAMYWSNEDTMYMQYKTSDILMWWGNSANIDMFKMAYP